MPLSNFFISPPDQHIQFFLGKEIIPTKNPAQVCQGRVQKNHRQQAA
jgi:hypothetical protein